MMSSSGSVFDFLFEYGNEEFSCLAIDFDTEACETVWRQFDLEGENPCMIVAPKEFSENAIESENCDYRFWQDCDQSEDPQTLSF